MVIRKLDRLAIVLKAFADAPDVAPKGIGRKALAEFVEQGLLCRLPWTATEGVRYALTENGRQVYDEISSRQKQSAA